MTRRPEPIAARTGERPRSRTEPATTYPRDLAGAARRDDWPSAEAAPLARTPTGTPRQADDDARDGAPISIADRSLFLNPHPVLHHLRANDPVHWSSDLGGWVLLRYWDVRQALHDPRLASTAMSRRIDRYAQEEQDALAELRHLVGQWMGLPTIEDHQRYSTLLRPHFSGEAVAVRMRGLAAHADRLLSVIARRGQCDIVADFAIPYTMGTVLRLCGLPQSPSVAADVASWVTDLSEVFHLSDLAGLQRAQRAAEEMSAFLREVIAERRGNPGYDLTGVFLRGLGSGQIRDEGEIVANLVMLLAVGFKTASNVIANGIYLLVANPSQMALLRDDPDRCRPAVEEIIRFDGPVFMTTRVAREALEIEGRRVAGGDLVLLCLAAANRDPAKFGRADEFLAGRSPNPHLGFGAGMYTCLGARLARAECVIAFQRILRWLPDLELAGPPGWYEFPPLARWLDRLPVRCPAARKPGRDGARSE
jgi:cytochrome P450